MAVTAGVKPYRCSRAFPFGTEMGNEIQGKVSTGMEQTDLDLLDTRRQPELDVERSENGVQ